MLIDGFRLISLDKVKNNNYNLVRGIYREVNKSGKYLMGTISEVAQLLNGYAFKSDNFSEFDGFPIIRIRDIKTNSTETKYNNNDYDKKYVVQNGDIIIGMDGEFNVAMWNGGEALLNQRLCMIVPNEKILKKYLFHVIKKPLKDIENNTTFTTVKHISSKQILEIQIPLPPLTEQQKIVDELDRIQKSIESANDLIKNLKIEGGTQYFVEMKNLRLCA